MPSKDDTRLKQATIRKEGSAEELPGGTRRDSLTERIELVRESREPPPKYPPGTSVHPPTPAHANVQVVGMAPPMASAQVLVTSAHSTGLLLSNTTQAQQQLSVASHRALGHGIQKLLVLPTAANATSATGLNRQLLVQMMLGVTRR